MKSIGNPKYYMSLLVSCFLMMGLVSCKQVTIEMTETIGVYYVPCEIDGLPLQLVFDTGASYVSISRPMTLLLERYGYITKDDYIGTTPITVGDGYTKDCPIINLSTVKVGNLLVHDVQGVIIEGSRPLMMLGQSAIKKLGKTTIDGNTLHIRPGKECTVSTYDTDSAFETWNSKEASYCSRIYGIKWDLPKSAKWNRMIIRYDKDFFCAWSDYSIVKLSVSKMDRYVDVWENYESVFQAAELLLQDAEFEGSTIENRKQEKCTIQGEHAIKDTFKEICKDGDIDWYLINHYFVHNGYYVTASLRIDSDIYENYDCQPFIDKAVEGISF